MTYLNKKLRVFENVKDSEIYQPRSAGRMKTYHSATDTRSWCDASEDRRQYILDLVKVDKEKSLSAKKHTPIRRIVSILLTNKNANIKQLQLKPAKVTNSKAPVKQTSCRKMINSFSAKSAQKHEKQPNLSKMFHKGDHANIAAHNLEDFRKKEKSETLKKMIKVLEQEEKILEKQIKKNEEIAQFLNNLNYLKQCQAHSNITVFTSSAQQVKSNSSFTNQPENQPLQLDMKAQTQLELSNKINKSIVSLEEIKDSEKGFVSENQIMHKVDILQKNSDHFSSKLDSEKNNIFNGNTNNVTKIKLKIDIVGNDKFSKPKHKCLRNNGINKFFKGGVKCSYFSNGKMIHIQHSVRKKSTSLKIVSR